MQKPLNSRLAGIEGLSLEKLPYARAPKRAAAVAPTKLSFVPAKKRAVAVAPTKLSFAPASKRAAVGAPAKVSFSPAKKRAAVGAPTKVSFAPASKRAAACAPTKLSCVRAPRRTATDAAFMPALRPGRPDGSYRTAPRDGAPQYRRRPRADRSRRVRSCRRHKHRADACGQPRPRRPSASDT